MATLNTGGSRLSALPRAPAVPRNVGVLDVKSIYDGVRQGLESFEAVRRAPASMLLADTQMAEQTAQAPLRTRQVLAQTEGIEQQTPLRTQALAESVSPERIAAERQALMNRSIRAPSGDVQTAEALARAEQRVADDPTDEYARRLVAALAPMALKKSATAAVDPNATKGFADPAEARAFNLLTEGMTPEEKAIALRVKLGMQARPSSAAITYQKVMGADGVERFVAVDPRAVGAHVIGTGETYGSGVGSQTPQISATPLTSGEPATPNVAASGEPKTDANGGPFNSNLFQSPTIKDKKQAEEMGKATADMIVESRAKLPKARAALKSFETKSDNVNSLINEAIAKTNNLSSGYGVVFKNWPKSEAMKLDSLLTSIRSNIGFDTLQDMRNNSPTGGALGQVSDIENRLLQSVIIELRQAAGPEFLIPALERVRDFRKQVLAERRNALAEDMKRAGMTDADFTAAANEAKKPVSLGGEATQQVGEFKIIEIK